MELLAFNINVFPCILISLNKTHYSKISTRSELRARYKSTYRSESSAFIPMLNLVLRQRFYSELAFNIIHVRIW